MLLTGCPNQELLAAYHLGKLSEAQIDAMAEHVEACSACHATLQGLEATKDTVLEGLRQVAAEVDVHDTAFAAALARAEAMPLAEDTAVGHDGPQPTDAALPDGLAPAGRPSPSVSELGAVRDYRLLEKLGSGGMGTVYKALHTRLDKVVALKVLPAERVADARALARFQREMKAVGRLDHPHIVHATDAGEADGTHFLVMQYVDGIDLSELVRRCGPLSIADACEIIRQAADGLQYAHEHGLVHRDIKPSNLMIARASGSSTHDAEPAVKILDFGLALLQAAEPPLGHELTDSGQIMGTADYMAPEQVSSTHDVDIRADIYSLGCTLYKLLTGHAPFSGPGFDTPILKMLGHFEKPIPPIHDERPDVPDELATVLNRMLAKNPTDRYATPGAVADALVRFTQGHALQALLAGGAAPMDANSFVLSRNHASSATAAGAHGQTKTPPKGLGDAAAAPRRLRYLVSVLVVLGLAFVGFFVADGIRVRTKFGTLELKIDVPEIEAMITEEGVTIRDRATGRTYSLNVTTTQLDPGDYAIEVREGPEGLHFETTRFTITRGGKAVVAVSLEQAKGALATEPQRGGFVRRLSGHTLGVNRVVFSHAPLALSGSNDKTLRLWNLETGVERRVFTGHEGSVRALALSADGRRALSGAASGQDYDLRLWDVDSGQETRQFKGHSARVNNVAFSPDARFAISCSFDETMRLWDTQTGAEIGRFEGHEGIPRTVRFSPDGAQVVSGGNDATVRLWDVKERRELRRFVRHGAEVYAVAVSADGRRIISGSGDGTARVWDMATAAELARFEHSKEVFGVALSHQGDRAVTGSRDGTVRWWSVEKGVELQRWKEHSDAVMDVALSPDDKLALSASMDRTIGLWRLPRE